MTNKQSLNKQIKKRDIHERIYNFVIRIVNLTKALPKSSQNDLVIHQLIKSATSMGANDQEADGAQSKKDFIAKYSIVKKENKETNYWLRIIADTNPAEIADKIGALQQEGLELVRIVSAIILSSKRKI